MGACSAQILIGRPHPDHGGIIPSHYLFLSENSRPAWSLVNQNIYQEEKRKRNGITWIPSLENMLEDAFVMIAVHICKNQDLIDIADGFGCKILSNRIEIYASMTNSQREQLYLKTRDIENFPKLIISIFNGSSIESHLPVLEQYKMDVEVCRVSYSRLYSSWKEETVVRGSLD